MLWVDQNLYPVVLLQEPFELVVPVPDDGLLARPAQGPGSSPALAQVNIVGHVVGLILQPEIRHLQALPVERRRGEAIGLGGAFAFFEDFIVDEAKFSAKGVTVGCRTDDIYIVQSEFFDWNANIFFDPFS